MADVNYIKHWNEVNLKFSKEDKKDIRPVHIAVYNALFQIWNISGFDTELSINRNDIMFLAKIGNKNTYKNCLRDLDKLGYIDYNPSHNPLIGSCVTMHTFGHSSESSSGLSSELSSGSSSGTLYKLYKLLNLETIKHIYANFKIVNENIEHWIRDHKAKYPTLEILSLEPKEKSSAKKEKKGNKKFIPPTLDEMKEYFVANGFDVDLARRVWQGYKEADWHDSQGKPIKNWKQKVIHVWFKDSNKSGPDKEKTVSSKIATV